jgi:hypothetical protein
MLERSKDTVELHDIDPQSLKQLIGMNFNFKFDKLIVM